MPKTKKTEIKLTEMTPVELTAEARNIRAQIQKTRLDVIRGKFKNLRGVFNLRKKLARTLTVLNSAPKV